MGKPNSMAGTPASSGCPAGAGWGAEGERAAAADGKAGDGALLKLPEAAASCGGAEMRRSCSARLCGTARPAAAGPPCVVSLRASKDPGRQRKTLRIMR